MKPSDVSPAMFPLLRLTIDELRAVAGSADLRAELLARRLHRLRWNQDGSDRVRALRDAASAMRAVAERLERDWRVFLAPRPADGDGHVRVIDRLPWR